MDDERRRWLHDRQELQENLDAALAREAQLTIDAKRDVASVTTRLAATTRELELLHQALSELTDQKQQALDKLATHESELALLAAENRRLLQRASETEASANAAADKYARDVEDRKRQVEVLKKEVEDSRITAHAAQAAAKTLRAQLQGAAADLTEEQQRSQASAAALRDMQFELSRLRSATAQRGTASEGVDSGALDSARPRAESTLHSGGGGVSSGRLGVAPARSSGGSTVSQPSRSMRLDASVTDGGSATDLGASSAYESRTIAPSESDVYGGARSRRMVTNDDEDEDPYYYSGASAGGGAVPHQRRASMVTESARFTPRGEVTYSPRGGDVPRPASGHMDDPLLVTPASGSSTSSSSTAGDSTTGKPDAAASSAADERKPRTISQINKCPTCGTALGHPPAESPPQRKKDTCPCVVQ